MSRHSKECRDFLIYRVRRYNAMIMKATERCCLISLIFFIDKFVLAYQTILNVLIVNKLGM